MAKRRVNPPPHRTRTRRFTDRSHSESGNTQQPQIQERRENCAEFSRALKTTGNPFVDQKNEGIHIATGTDKMRGGTTPGAMGGISVEHWDFIVSKIDEIVAI